MIPLTTFTGNLKFTRQDFADQFALDAFSFVAPAFSDAPAPPGEESIKRGDSLLGLAARSGFETSSQELEIKMRRYAGDSTLSRGSYFGVCQQDSDWDGCVLINEINAYRIPEKSGYAIVGDLSEQAIADEFNNGKTEHQLFILIRDVELFISQFPQHASLSANGNSIGVKFPYVVEHFEIDKVIDLRLPGTREWFFQTFKQGDGKVFSKSAGRDITSFYQMLPALMHLDLGGFNETRGIGVWMRRNEINALIYPSARCNTLSVIKDGELQYHSGWNLVDYRNTKSLPISDTIVDLSPWFNTMIAGVNYEIAPNDSPFAGSFKVVGNEEFHHEFWQRRVNLRTQKH